MSQNLEYSYKGAATREARCTETWTADTLTEAREWAAQLRANGVTEVRLEACNAREPEGTTHVHMAGTLRQAILYFGMTTDLEEKVFQQFEDGSEGEYSAYWPAVVGILMEWAAERGRRNLPATLSDVEPAAREQAVGKIKPQQTQIKCPQ